MKYLTGSINKKMRSEDLPPELGLMLQPNTHYTPLQTETWAADNGCFSQGERFKLVNYLCWLDRLPHRQNCLFAVAPDVLGDMKATLVRSLPVLPQLRGLGYKAALVAQDGAEHIQLPWDSFEALFIGGTTRWKVSDESFEIVQAALNRGKYVHMGRVNSFRRFKLAYLWRCHSVDGTYLRFGPDVNYAILRRWLTLVHQHRLFT